MISPREYRQEPDREREKRGQRSKPWGWILYAEAVGMRRHQQTVRSSGQRRGIKPEEYRSQVKSSWKGKDQMLIGQVI